MCDVTQHMSMYVKSHHTFIIESLSVRHVCNMSYVDIYVCVCVFNIQESYHTLVIERCRILYDIYDSHIWVRHVTYGCVCVCVCVTRMDEAYYMSHDVAYMLPVCKTHKHAYVTRYTCNLLHEYWYIHMNESRHTYEWVMSHICMSHVSHMNESCHTCERVMPIV